MTSESAPGGNNSISELSTDAIPIEPRHLDDLPDAITASEQEPIRSEQGHLVTTEQGPFDDRQQSMATEAMSRNSHGDTAASAGQGDNLQAMDNSRPQPMGRNNDQSGSIQDVTEVWAFNNFLVEVSECIQDDAELDKMKFLFREEIGLKVLGEIKSAIDLFDVLRKRCYINRHNVVWLQAVVRILKRPELDRRIIELVRKMGNAVYFFIPPDIPMNGYTPITVHVEGRDFSTCTKQHIQQIQLIVSNLLMTEMKYILIAGIQPSSSLLITIMIPDSHVVYLREMAESAEGIPGLIDMGVDAISIGGKTYNLYGVEEAELVETEQQRKFVTVYNQLEEKTRQLDEREVECLKLQREVALHTSSLDLQAYHLGASAHAHYVRQQRNAMAMSTVRVQTVSPLSKQSALAYFRFCLKAVAERVKDNDTIMMLLDANAKVVATRIQEEHAIRAHQLQLIVQSLQTHVFQLLFEKEIAHIRSDPSGFERVLRELTQTLRPQTQEVLLSVDPAHWVILKTISKSLRHRDRQKLYSKHEFKVNPKFNEALEKDRDSILACIYLNELEKSGYHLLTSSDQFKQIIVDCLLEVNRQDLKKKFLDLLGKLPKPEILHVPQQEAMNKQQQHQQQKQQQQQQQASSANAFTTKNMEEQLAKILKHVEDMDDIIQSTRSSFSHGIYGPLFDKNPLSEQYAFPASYTHE